MSRIRKLSTAAKRNGRNKDTVSQTPTSKMWCELMKIAANEEYETPYSQHVSCQYKIFNLTYWSHWPCCISHHFESFRITVRSWAFVFWFSPFTTRRRKLLCCTWLPLWTYFIVPSPFGSFFWFNHYWSLSLLSPDGSDRFLSAASFIWA